MQDARPYRGRFAPSPTGPLHFGSLVAAVASYADALYHRGEWRVRMEDVDEGRCVGGADAQILSILDAYGFQWHGEIVYQSQRKAYYRDTIEWLLNTRLAYRCACTRKEVQRQGRLGQEGVIYAGTCRNGLPAGRTARAIRVRTPNAVIRFYDRIYGWQQQNLQKDVGDFIIHRADGFTAYQLAVVVDDAQQDITQIVRGADLLFSTPRQIWLQNVLGCPHPQYAHIPLALDRHGQKLSKYTQAMPITPEHALPALLAAWQFLGQCSPPELDTVEDFWAWAQRHWTISRVPHRARIHPGFSR